MTWQMGPTMLTCQLTGRWHGMPTVYADIMITSSLSRSGTWVRSSGIRAGSAHPGEEDACDTWRASVSLASNLAGTWWRVRTLTTSDVDTVFTSGFVSSSSIQWYGQNIILTTFIFEQKSNTTLNHMLWYQLLGIRAPHARTGGVLIVVQRKLSTLTQYLMWFGKSPISTGKVNIIRDR